MTKNNEEVKVVDLVDVEEVTGDQQEVVEVEKKNNLVSKIKNLKTWQKVALGVAAVAGAGFGGKILIDAIKTKPDVVTDVIETAEGIVETTEFQSHKRKLNIV